MAFKGKGRQNYKNSRGRVSGVTTILGNFTNPGGLVYWAFKQGQAHPQATNVYATSDAAEAGTVVHEMIESWLHDEDPNTNLVKLDNQPATQKQVVNCFENFLEWWNNSGLRIVATEVPIVSEEYDVGGCVDAVCMDSQDRVCIVDWKTANGLYRDHLCQVAGYGLLWEETHPGVKIDGGYHICRYPKDNPDFHHHHFGDLDEARELFKLLVQAQPLAKAVEKRAK